MMQKTVGFILLMLLFSVFNAMNLVETVDAGGSTIYVDDDGGKDYVTIQKAIDAADDGDTVYIYNGVYYESLSVSKSITLIGEDNKYTIIDGKDIGNAINITNTNNVLIKNLNITADRKIKFQNETQTRYRPYCGIFFETVTNSTIENCNISDCYSDGIKFDFSFSIKSNNITIKNNIITNNSDGIDIDNANYISIISNIISFNDGEGISLSTSKNVIIDNIFASNNRRGISIPYSSRNISDNVIFHNRFINNSYPWIGQDNAVDGSGPNYWYNPDIKEGNYWDDYTGIDENKDGIGDTPYEIPGLNSKDLYPIIDEDSEKLVYIPGDYFDGFEDSDNEDTDEQNTEENNKESKNNDTPGFEFIFIIIGMILMIFWRGKNKL